jgi:hypothetical protein
MKERRSSKATGSEPAERQHAAEQLAIAALGFIAGEPERLERFLTLTGIALDSIRAAAREPNFLLGVLDYVAGDEALLLAFAQHAEIEPEEVAGARDVLARAPPEVP